ncbi:MAG TPA: FMN-binding negative transcriptional regulator [Ignavibacteriaceae bacterium]|nr:FMN-binding negative transcriptional regulator [Ignavibacteriaceae bacterium]
MYIPKIYSEKDKKNIFRIINDNPFGILIAAPNNFPQASHLLFELIEINSDIYLYSHLATANHLTKLLGSEIEFLSIFQGPSAYISPSWYKEMNVPTWNYIAVHCYGKTEIISNNEDEYLLLERLVKRFEGKYNHKYKLEELPKEFVKSEMRGVTSFKIKVDKIEAAFKLSQNRTDEDYRNIIINLRKSDLQEEQQISEEMRRKRNTE